MQAFRIDVGWTVGMNLFNTSHTWNAGMTTDTQNVSEGVFRLTVGLRVTVNYKTVQLSTHFRMRSWQPADTCICEGVLERSGERMQTSRSFIKRCFGSLHYGENKSLGNQFQNRLGVILTCIKLNTRNPKP